MDIVAGLMIMVVAFGFIIHFAPEHDMPRRWVPEVPPPPKPPTGMSGQELVSIMKKDLEDFKAGRPSMLGKTVSKHGDECGIDATDRDTIYRKMSEGLEADCRDPINWDKELKELK
jgi:hypothetical protein